MLASDCKGALSRRSTVRKELDPGPWADGQPPACHRISGLVYGHSRPLFHCLCEQLFMPITQGYLRLGGELNPKGDTSVPNWPHIPARRDRRVRSTLLIRREITRTVTVASARFRGPKCGVSGLGGQSAG